VLFIPFMIYSLTAEIYTFAVTQNYVAIITNYQSTMIFNTISATLLLVLDVWLPLFVRIVTLLVRLFRKKKPALDQLEKVINDPTLSEMFEKWCEKEYSIENLSAFKDIMEFKKTRNDPLNIYFKYLNGGSSVMEINISKKTCHAVYEKLKTGDFDSTLFDEIEGGVRINLSDTFSRFSVSYAYEKYVLMKKTQVELMEGTK
jgi:hypothetical protein